MSTTELHRGPLHGTTLSLELVAAASESATTYIIATFAGEEGLEIPASSLLTAEQTEAVLAALSALDAKGKAGEVVKIPAPESSQAAVIVAVGLGASEDLDAETVRRSAGVAARAVAGRGQVATTLADFELAAAVEGFILGGYTHQGLRSDDSAATEAATIELVRPEASAADDAAVVRSAEIIARATVLARDLTNTPANFLYPESYAEFLVNKAQQLGVAVEVLDEQQLAEGGFGGIIAVGQGSAHAPRLVRLSWEPAESTTSVALVGKGITFDTGGISLKPGNGMWDMVMDMGGSAAMAAAIFAAAELELPLKVTATLPLAENMPSDRATRPGDVITHYGGITSEVLNTDAEGRLVLADAIVRACEDKPDYLIEAATLTGAQLIALGDRTAGVMGSEELRDLVAETGRAVGENAWAVPLLEEHDEDIKSKVADVRNIHTKREAGMQFAGTYLKQFVAEDIQWVHIDVAGPAWNGGGARGYTVPRATGAPTRTVVETLRQLSER